MYDESVQDESIKKSVLTPGFEAPSTLLLPVEETLAPVRHVPLVLVTDWQVQAHLDLRQQVRTQGSTIFRVDQDVTLSALGGIGWSVC